MGSERLFQFVRGLVVAEFSYQARFTGRQGNCGRANLPKQLRKIKSTVTCLERLDLLRCLDCCVAACSSNAILNYWFPGDHGVSPLRTAFWIRG